MGSTFIVHGDRVHVVGLTKPLREAADMDNHSCDERYLAYLNEQEEARRADYHSEDPAAFRRHLARIRQGAQGAFEYRAPDGLWYPSDFSVVRFRSGFVLVSEKSHMKVLCSQEVASPHRCGVVPSQVSAKASAPQGPWCVLC